MSSRSRKLAPRRRPTVDLRDIVRGRCGSPGIESCTCLTEIRDQEPDASRICRSPFFLCQEVGAERTIERRPDYVEWTPADSAHKPLKRWSFGRRKVVTRHSPEPDIVSQNMRGDRLPFQCGAPLLSGADMAGHEILDCIATQGSPPNTAKHTVALRAEITLQPSPQDGDRFAREGVQRCLRPLPSQRTCVPRPQSTSSRRRLVSSDTRRPVCSATTRRVRSRRPIQVVVSGAATRAVISVRSRNAISFRPQRLLGMASTRWHKSACAGSAKAT